jgi:hypothetical protein
VRLALAWFMTVLLLFSFSSYKLPHYLMPAYPATALMVGIFGAAVLRASVSRRWLWCLPALLAALLFGAGAVLVALLLRRAFRLPFSDPSYLLPILLLAGAALIIASVLTGRDSGVLAAIATTLVAGYAWSILVISPRELRRFQPIPHLARAVARVARPGEPVAVAGNYGMPGLVFYAHRSVRQLADRQDLLRYLSDPGPRHCVLPRADFEAVQPLVSRAWRIVDESAVFSVRMRRLLERAPERAGRTLVLITAQ